MMQKVYKRKANSLVDNFGFGDEVVDSLNLEFDKIQEASDVGPEALEEAILTFLESDASQEEKFLYMYKFGAEQGYGEAMARLNGAIKMQMSGVQ